MIVKVDEQENSEYCNFHGCLTLTCAEIYALFTPGHMKIKAKDTTQVQLT